MSGGQQPGIIDITWSVLAFFLVPLRKVAKLKIFVEYSKTNCFRSVVPCSFSEELQFINNSGTSQYWVSIQVASSNTAIQSLEISQVGTENWKALKLGTDSNYCENFSKLILGDLLSTKKHLMI